MSKIRLYEIGVERHKLTFDGLCVGGTVIVDGIEIRSKKHNIDIGWCELFICDQLVLKCPFAWLFRDGLNITLNKYENFSLRIISFDETDSWFHGSEVQLIMIGPDGKEIEIECRGRYDCYTRE